MAKTGIIFCTPTQLIRRISKDPSVIGSSRFILDEFHTRTVMFDVLFALLLKYKSALREPFQLVLMSATPDQVIVNALNGAQTLRIDDCSPYTITRQSVIAANAREATKTKPGEVAAEFVKEMVQDKKPHGNILCFTSGQKECEAVCTTFQDRLRD